MIVVTEVTGTIRMAFGSPNPHQGQVPFFLDARVESSDLLGYELITLSVQSKLKQNDRHATD